MKRLLITVAALVLISISGSAFADPVTVQIGAKVNFITPENLGLSVEEIEQGLDYGTPLWEGKQCCLQSIHRAGVQSEYCYSERVQEQLKHCDIYLELYKTPTKETEE